MNSEARREESEQRKEKKKSSLHTSNGSSELKNLGFDSANSNKQVSSLLSFDSFYFPTLLSFCFVFIHLSVSVLILVSLSFFM